MVVLLLTCSMSNKSPTNTLVQTNDLFLLILKLSTLLEDRTYIDINLDWQHLRNYIKL